MRLGTTEDNFQFLVPSLLSDMLLLRKTLLHEGIFPYLFL